MKKLCLNDLHCVSGGGLGVGIIVDGSTTVKKGDPVLYYRDKANGKVMNLIIDNDFPLDQAKKFNDLMYYKPNVFEVHPVLSDEERESLIIKSLGGDLPGQKKFLGLIPCDDVSPWGFDVPPHID